MASSIIAKSEGPTSSSMASGESRTSANQNGLVSAPGTGATTTVAPGESILSSSSTSAFHPVPSSNSNGGPTSVIASKGLTAGRGPIPNTSLSRRSSSSSSSSAGRRPRSPLAAVLTTRSRSSSAASGSPSRLQDVDDDDERPETGDAATHKDAFAWPSHFGYDERRQLIGTEEESSERQSSDEEDDRTPWTITREQLNYYTTQFFSMQANPRGVIPGSQAKEFFEKSRLPIQELRKIWQLSDVTQDGCLSLEEFLTAMHLVVLRRNDIELPDTLPASLQPGNLRSRVVGDRHNRDLYGDDDHGESVDGDGGRDLLLHDEDDNISLTNSTTDTIGSVVKPVAAVAGSSALSPGSVSSPGPRPVNFDFHRPDARRNPNLVHPVAVRLSPESPVIPTSDDEDATAPSASTGARQVLYEQLWNQDDVSNAEEETVSSVTLKGDSVSSRSRQQRPSDDENVTDEEDIDEDDEDGRPRGLLLGPVSLPPAHRREASSPPPPMPPPRVTATHARSSSLDLNQIGRKPPLAAAPPTLPPRLATGATALEVDSPSNSESASPSASSTSSGTSSGVRRAGGSQLASAALAADSRDAKLLQMRIHQFREKNSVVARTINELHQEVSDALEERIALEFQLEQLKSFGD